MKTCHILLTMLPYYAEALRRESTQTGALGDGGGAAMPPLRAKIIIAIRAIWSLDLATEARMWKHMGRVAYHDPQYAGTRAAHE